MSTWTNIITTQEARFKTELWKIRVDDKTFALATKHKPFGSRPGIWDMQIVFSHPTNPSGLPEVFIVKGDHRDKIASTSRDELRQWCEENKTQP